MTSSSSSSAAAAASSSTPSSSSSSSSSSSRPFLPRRELLHVKWDGIFYSLQSESSFPRKSNITECEDVSYVSSAYIPQCLRYGGRPTLSNAHRSG
jgi:hypothetical protein